MDASMPAVTLRSPADVLGCLPYQVGFHPTESVVVVCLHGPRRRGGLTMRIDLPAPAFEPELARQLADRAFRADADAAIAVCYTDAEIADTGVLPRHLLLSGLAAELAVQGIPVIDTLLVRRSRWWSYGCADTSCCPTEGTLLPTNSTTAADQVAAAAVMRGVAVLDDRAALVASIRPAADPRAAAELQLVYDDIGRALPSDGSTPLSRGDAAGARAQTVDLLGQAVRRYAVGPCRLSDVETARIVLGLRDKVARDTAATLVLDRHDQALCRLLVDLAQRAPSPVAAPVCTVLAWVAYQQGAGALANVALERALDSEPGYEMALLLEHAFDAQLPPAAMRELTRRVRTDLQGAVGPSRRRAVRGRRRRTDEVGGSLA